MMLNNRIIILSGHYGSGKTNLAVNLALALKQGSRRVFLADMDIVNPYYRSKDSARDLEQAGIGLICSGFANSNLDVPALPKELYAVTGDRTARFILDVGGDDRGALALGRLSGEIVEENDFAMLAVVNCYRPMTKNAADTVAVLREIESACKIPFTAIVNNSNLGEETVPQTVLDSLAYADAVSRLMGLPIALTAVREDLTTALSDKIPNLFPLKLQARYK